MNILMFFQERKHLSRKPGWRGIPDDYISDSNLKWGNAKLHLITAFREIWRWNLYPSFFSDKTFLSFRKMIWYDTIWCNKHKNYLLEIKKKKVLNVSNTSDQDSQRFELTLQEIKFTVLFSVQPVY